MNAELLKWNGHRRISNPRSRKFMIVEIRPPPSGSQGHRGPLSSERSPPSRKRCRKSILLESYSSRRVGLSTRDIIVPFESNGFDLADTTSMDSKPFCSVCMSQPSMNSRCNQIARREYFVMTHNNISRTRVQGTKGATPRKRRLPKNY